MLLSSKHKTIAYLLDRTSKNLKILIIFFLRFLTIVDASSTNVARGKPSKDCAGASLSSKITDGSSDFEFFEVISACEINTFVEIDLGNDFEVHYVVVHEGNNSNPALDQLAYFMVKLTKDVTWPCGEFNGKSLGPSYPMRVNCRPTGKLAFKVKVEARNKESLYIAEIEAFNIGPGIPSERFLIFRGCFSVFGNTQNGSPVAEPIINECHQYCIEKQNSHIGIKNGRCFCSDGIQEMKEISTMFCDGRCDNMSCGSDIYYSVYIGMLRLPTYYGCYRISNLPNISLVRGNMTIGMCLIFCDDFQYALLRDRVECYCKKGQIEQVDEVYNGCTKRCGGHYRSFCGGLALASVFQTCKSSKPDDLTNCNKLLKCSAEINTYGLCNGSCKGDFRGQYCFEKVFSSSLNPAVFDNKSQPEKCRDQCKYYPNTVCVIEDYEAVCKCKSGFQKTPRGFCISFAANRTDEDSPFGGPAPMFIVIPLFCLVTVGGICCFGSTQLHENEEKLRGSRISFRSSSVKSTTPSSSQESPFDSKHSRHAVFVTSDIDSNP